MSKLLTIYDLAKNLGLSVSTTSKAINGYPDVSPATRSRVLQRAKELGFEPSMAAKSNTTKQSFLIGVIYSDEGEGLMHPHFSAILEHFRRTVEPCGYQLLFIVESSAVNHRTLVQTCRYRGVDGVLIMAFDRESERLQEVLDSDIPSVLVDFELPGCTSVLSDNVSGMQRIVDYCWDHGHRKFCYISSPRGAQASEERLSGVMNALKRHGVDLTDDRIFVGEKHSFHSGYDCMQNLLKRGTDATVVITAYDRLAFGAMYCLQTHGIDVPNDLSITGFDDLPSDQMIFWKLTTARQQRDLIGIKAGQLLLDAITDEAKSCSQIRLDTPLIVRSSVKTILPV